MAFKKSVLTKSGVEKLENELRELKEVRRAEIAQKIKEARMQGDLSENAEYDAAKELQAKNEYDIALLEAELKSARIIDEAQLDADIVNVGSVVTLEMKGTGSLLKYKIVGSAETDPANNRISNESPVGKAVLGHRRGETVEVVTPGGVRFFLIREIGR